MSVSDAIAKERADNATVFAAFHEQYVTKYIQLADAKAGATFTICSGAFAYLWTRDAFIAAILHSRAWGFVAVSGIAMLLLASGSAMAFYVIAPRLARSGRDLVFWKSVAELPHRDGLADAVLSSSREIRRAYRALQAKAKRLGLTVDHIVPIAGCRVYGAKGLHEPSNWQMLAGGENAAKRNREFKSLSRHQSCPNRPRARVGHGAWRRLSLPNLAMTTKMLEPARRGGFSSPRGSNGDTNMIGSKLAIIMAAGTVALAVQAGPSAAASVNSATALNSSSHGVAGGLTAMTEPVQYRRRCWRWNRECRDRWGWGWRYRRCMRRHGC